MCMLVCVCFSQVSCCVSVARVCLCFACVRVCAFTRARAKVRLERRRRRRDRETTDKAAGTRDKRKEKQSAFRQRDIQNGCFFPLLSNRFPFSFLLRSTHVRPVEFFFSRIDVPSMPMRDSRAERWQTLEHDRSERVQSPRRNFRAAPTGICCHMPAQWFPLYGNFVFCFAAVSVASS